jgi:Uma2 family endonuclease
MPAIVSTRTAHFKPHRFTISEYLAMGSAGILDADDRVELIDGQVVGMSPIGNWHTTSVRRLARHLHAQLPEELRVDVQGPVNIGEHTQVTPDVALIRASQDGWATSVRGQDCLLVVEVAESSLKMALYAAAGIPEYWVVDLAGRTVEVYTNGRQDGYGSRTVHHRGSVVAPHAVPKARVQVSNVVPPPDAESSPSGGKRN